jgi:hypothetical protein
MITSDQVERFRDIIYEIEELMGEAKDIVRGAERITQERFRGYPYAHITMELNENHEFLGGSMFTLSDIADELDEQASEKSEDDDS